MSAHVYADESVIAATADYSAGSRADGDARSRRVELQRSRSGSVQSVSNTSANVADTECSAAATDDTKSDARPSHGTQNANARSMAIAPAAATIAN